MSASLTETVHKTHTPETALSPASTLNPLCPSAGCLNLSELLTQPQSAPVSGGGKGHCHDKQKSFFSGQGTLLLNGPGKPTLTVAGAGSGSNTSLAQLMSKHEQKIQGSVTAGTGQSSSLASLSLGLNAPHILSSGLQTGLSVGTLASLHSAPLGSTPRAPPPSILTASLGNLSLGSTRRTGAALAPPPAFGSLSAVLQNTRPMDIGTEGGVKGKEPKGSPSLAELIQEHSNSSPTLYSSLPGPHNNMIPSVKGATEKTTAPMHSLSLSQLAAQHQANHTHTTTPAHPPSLFTLHNPGPPGLLGALSLSQPVSQRGAVTPRPPSTAASAAFKPSPTGPPPGLTGMLSLAQLAGLHQTTTSSNAPEYSLSSLLSPGRTQGGSEQPGNLKEGGVRDKVSPKQPWSGQSVDLSTLMAQSPRQSLPRHDYGLASPTDVEFGSDATIFARPSVFALALSVRSPSQRKRKRMKAAGEQGERTFRAFLYATQTQLVKAKKQAPLLPITPFCFETPSPDDIVRANQKKAFTR